ncbi:HTTM domain-containing protein [Frigoribacterium sp. PhB24]|uniref:HTTM domain-containing protein n=1 Tax=Frigoribacterium sp. PhB24 TaxID=2485204 RepID=UPI000F46D01C|nr:HTTM domain-containing protein [Frigoribacterium sp. PhB24]ROS48418.1 vitamin K-dependent gamma-carboxylase-like protein [Frigoribacterium sp. PhB24]
MTATPLTHDAPSAHTDPVNTPTIDDPGRETGGTPRLRALIRRRITGPLSVAEAWLTDRKHAQYGLAMARMLIGVAIIGFCLTNFATRNYTFGAGAAWSGQLQFSDSDFAGIWPFSLVNATADNSIALGAVFCILIASGIAIAIGWRTRIAMTIAFVFWVGLLSINVDVQDQSDNLSRMAMIYLFFTSPAHVWSLDARRRARSADTGNILRRWWNFQPALPARFTTLLHNLAVIVLGAQLCMLYAAGGLYKAQGAPWYRGYAIYNPLQTAQFGTWPELSHLITVWAPLVALGTIMTVLVQVGFPLLLMRRPTRVFALLVILGFHSAIGLLMGLPWFSLWMLALDSLFVRDATYRTMAHYAKGPSVSLAKKLRHNTTTTTTTPSLSPQQ